MWFCCLQQIKGSTGNIVKFILYSVCNNDETMRIQVSVLNKLFFKVLNKLQILFRMQSLLVPSIHVQYVYLDDQVQIKVLLIPENFFLDKLEPPGSRGM
jgi:hypothetical protein